MTVAGTVCPDVVAKSTCEPYNLRAIVTSSMKGTTGLLGYPDLLCLGTIPDSFPLINTHCFLATVDTSEGCLPDQCGEDRSQGEVTVGRVTMEEEKEVEEIKVHEVVEDIDLDMKLDELKERFSGGTVIRWMLKEG